MIAIQLENFVPKNNWDCFLSWIGHWSEETHFNFLNRAILPLFCLF